MSKYGACFRQQPGKAKPEIAPLEGNIVNLLARDDSQVKKKNVFFLIFHSVRSDRNSFHLALLLCCLVSKYRFS